MTDFGTYLKQLRKAKGLTLTDIESVSSVSNSYLSQVENGKYVPSHLIIRELSKALDVSYIGMLIKAGYLTEEELIEERTRRGVIDAHQDQWQGH